MAKIIVEKGLPASGKSTCSRNRLEKDGNCVRVNRDDIRAMGFGMLKWSPKREKWTVAAEQEMIKVALLNGFTPIVDSTNLTEKRLSFFKEFAKKLEHDFRPLKVTVEYCDHTDVPIATCVERDKTREGTARVGRVIIEKLAAQAGMLKTDKKVVLCDIDGTTADLTERKKWLNLTCKECDGGGVTLMAGEGYAKCKACDGKGKKSDWHEFFRGVLNDKPIWQTINMLHDFKLKGYEIWMVSGRAVFEVKGDECLRVGDETVEWLDKYQIPYSHIFMRDAGDTRPDTLVKHDILKGQILRNISMEQIECVVDDRPSVIRMWQENGLKVIDVGDGIDF